MPKNKRRKVNKNRYKNGYDSRDSGGATKSALNWGLFKGSKPKTWRPNDKGVNRFNIIPFEVKSKNHPLVKDKVLKVGDLDYCLDLFIHKNVGPDKVPVICLKKNYGKSCPICDYVSELYDKDTKDSKKAAVAIKAKKRSFFNIQPIVKGEVEDMHIYEASHYRFTKELIEEANECGEGEDILDFSDIEDGKVVQCRGSETEFKGDIEFKGWKFNERDEELDEDLIDEAVSFDSLIVIPTADQIEKIMYGQDDEDDDSEEEEPEDTEDEEEEEKPKKSEPEEDDDDEEDNEDEEEEPPKKSKKNKSSGDCPHGHKFGEVDEHKACKKCKNWDACDEKATNG